MKILITEDDPIMILALEKALPEMGYTISDVVNTGKDAQEAVAKNRPDLLLMDIMIEGDMDGVDTALAIKANYDIPVVFLTSQMSDELIKKVKTTDPHGYVLKPFKKQQLQSVIELAFHKSKVERQLKDSETRYRELFEHSSDLIQATDAEGRLIYVNDAWKEVLGYSKKDVAHLNFFELIHDNHRDKVKKSISDIGQDEEPKLIEFALLTREGLVIDVEGNLSAKTEDGRLMQVRAILRDITLRNKTKRLLEEANSELEERVEERTRELSELNSQLKREIGERVKMEQALRDSEQDYKGLFDNAHDAVLIFNPEDEVILDMNARACEVYGYSKTEFVGMSFRELVWKEGEIETMMEQLRKKGKISRYQSAHQSKNKTEIGVMINASVVQFKRINTVMCINRVEY